MDVDWIIKNSIHDHPYHLWSPTIYGGVKTNDISNGRKYKYYL